MTLRCILHRRNARAFPDALGATGANQPLHLLISPSRTWEEPSQNRSEFSVQTFDGHASRHSDDKEVLQKRVYVRTIRIRPLLCRGFRTTDDGTSFPRFDPMFPQALRLRCAQGLKSLCQINVFLCSISLSALLRSTSSRVSRIATSTASLKLMEYHRDTRTSLRNKEPNPAVGCVRSYCRRHAYTTAEEPASLHKTCSCFEPPPEATSVDYCYRVSLPPTALHTPIQLETCQSR